MIVDLFSGLLSGICLAIVINLPILPFILSYKKEVKKDPEGMQKAKKEFIKLSKEIFR